MTESLVAKFKDMSDREILIATCLKVEGLECRIDKHSVERDQDKEDVLKSFKQLTEEQRTCDDRIKALEAEKKTKRALLSDAGGIVGLVGGALAIWSRWKGSL